jgi:site-specific DNA-methyltransferase (adenine-specific)
MYTLLNADAVDALRTLGDETVDFVFADPPYHLSNGGFTVHSGKSVSVNKGTWDTSNGFEADLSFHMDWLQEAKRVLRTHGTIVVSGTYHSIYRCGYALESLGFRILNEIVWYKPNAAPNLSGRNFAASHETLIWASKSRDAKHVFNYALMKTYDESGDSLKNVGKQMRDVWAIPSAPLREKKLGRHPTQKPLELMKRLLLACTNEGDVVLDPFVGSGTTGVAAVTLNRTFIGIDIDPQYMELATKRINEVMGEMND